MAILNYTTVITTEKTVGEIQAMLVRAKAAAVLTEYEDLILTAISFRVPTRDGLLTFRLPANVPRFYQVLLRDKSVPARLRTQEQAARVAWRILKDWLAAQLAIIEAGMVDLAQVFLPYLQVTPEGRTVYEVLSDRHFDAAPLIGGGTDPETTPGT